jgi:DNA polymerase-3 subunit alpha
LHPIEDLGLLKMDFLGLSNLTILETCLRLIQERHGITIDFNTLNYDDKKTFQLFQRGDTTGVFQLESSGMKRYLRELKPTTIEDIIAMVALYRPGPMELIPKYVARKHGKEPITYVHPLMESVLKSTYGIIVYQEQVMDMATKLAGMTKGQGYLLIKAVGKKIKSLLDEQKDKFIQGCIDNGIEKAQAKETWELIEPFARYGFNKAHSACYAVIAYQTAYCKANYPAEFMAALLTSDQHNTDRIAIEIEDARRMGIAVLPPDINESEASFSVVSTDDGSPSRTIRFGLNAVKNVGEHLVEAIIAERKRGGAFASLEDVLERVQHKDLNKKSMESLAKVGAFDRFAERQVILSSMEEILKFGKLLDTAASSGQINLFASLPTTYRPTLRLKEVPPASNIQRGTWEKELMGLYISDHPLNAHRRTLEKLVRPISTLGEITSATKIGGLISTVKKIVTKKNEPMAFVRLEDLSGSIEVVVFPKLYQSSALLWEEGRLVVVEGKSNVREGEWKMLADKVWDLQSILQKIPSEEPVKISVNLEGSTPQDFQELQTLLKTEPGNRAIEFVVTKGAQTKIVPTPITVDWNEGLRSRLEARFGRCIVE